MRTNDRVTLVKRGKSEYDPILGEEVEQGAERIIVPCRVTDLGIERSVELFGDYTERRMIVRFDRVPMVEFDYLEYQNEEYKLLSETIRGKALYVERETP